MKLNDIKKSTELFQMQNWLGRRIRWKQLLQIGVGRTEELETIAEKELNYRKDLVYHCKEAKQKWTILQRI